MLFNSNRFRFYFKFSENKRKLSLIGLILLIFIFIQSRKSAECWIDKYRSRLLCFVLTSEIHLDNRARVVYETWGQRCGKFLFIGRFNSTIIQKNFAHLPIENVPNLPHENYSNLPEKVRQTLLHFNRFYSDYDWYLKADDDTFIIVENLLRFLISKSNEYPMSLLYGYRFREDYYVSGGAGYVITKQAVELFSKYMHLDEQYRKCNSSMEDLMVGTCLQKILQIEPKEKTKDLMIVGDSVDSLGRERFHPLAFRLHFGGPQNKFKREWIHFRPFHHNLHNYDGISETTISFHYTDISDMYQTDTFIYQIRQFHKHVCAAQL